LSNLFRLDHLATRMRRNAESLLVLAGVEPPRKWAAPVRLTDVIRAALGEVEDYQRVTVRGVEPATIVGAAAADLAHLLAELIENALVFSPPDQTVDIRGRIRQGVGPQGNGPRALPATMRPDDLSERAHDGDGGRVRHGGYTLAVIDSGLGMTAADMEAANRRLASEESFTIAPSKYLGHYVAGNLALRHGIRVRLDNSPGNGITATVHIPPALLTTDAVTSAPVTPPQGMRPSGVALAARDTALPAPPAPEPPAPWPPDPLPPPAPPWEPIEPAARSYDQEPAAPSRSVFDAPAPADPAPPGWLTEPPPYQPTRTASGLVKRPRPGEGVGAPATAAHASANEDLLASLGRIAGTSRSGEPSGPPAWTAPPPGAAPSDASPRRWPEGVGTGDQRFDPRSTQPTASPLAAPPSSPPSPGPASSPVPPTPPLTRRVKGAQLPAADPMLVRRGAGAARPAAPGPAPRRTMPAAGDGRRSPDDVYSFLTSFTAGVQRGLDETNPPGPDSSPTG
jgi:hypothetical protein